MRSIPILMLAGLAGGIYFLDSQQGRSRRARIRDKLAKMQRMLARSLASTSRDLSNRTRGRLAELRSDLLAKAFVEPVEDQLLHERVRSRIGHLVARPGTIDVSVENGRVLLTGLVFEHEFGRLVRGVEKVRGVSVVENRLNILSDPTQIPVFPGAVGANRIIRRFWKPAVRVLVGGSGAGLAWAGVRRGGLMGATMVAGGTALLAKAASKTGPGNLFDAARDEAIELRKTIIVEAPLSDVYRLWSAYENFPRFMSNVQEVRLIGGRRSHWVVGGPLSIPVEWDAVITTMEPMHVLAWKTLSGPAVQHAGVVNFEDSGDDTTRVSVHLTYRPAGGIVGQSVASLFHADPGRQMDEDLMRMKVFIETGVRPGAAGDAVPSTHLDLDAPVQEPVGARRRSRGDTGPDPEEIG